MGIGLQIVVLLKSGGTSAALGDVARARNMTQLALKTGMTRMGLYKALSGQGNPSFATVSKVAHALGLKITVAAG